MSNNQILITPEAYQKSNMDHLTKRQLRDQSIVNMRKSDPNHWTLERLANYWGTKKQNIHHILQKHKMT